MKKKRRGFWETLSITASMGFVVLLWLFGLEIAALVVSALIGIGVAIFTNWTSGILIGILAWLIINKLLWYCEIFDMILSGREPETKPSPPESPPSS